MSTKSISDTLSAVRKDIESLRSTLANLMNAGQFEKDGEPNYVVRSNLVHDIAKRRFRQIRDCDKKAILGACEELLKCPPTETNTVAIDWAVKLRKSYSQDDFTVFEQWLQRYVRGWGLCDALCCGPLGYLLFDVPVLAAKTRQWAKDQSLWLRRAAAVALIPSVEKGESFDLAIEIADTLLTDSEDYVQKGYGWLLKVASKRYQTEVFEYVMSRKDRMPRIALRYSLEKMPPALRRRAMAKT